MEHGHTDVKYVHVIPYNAGRLIPYNAGLLIP